MATHPSTNRALYRLTSLTDPDQRATITPDHQQTDLCVNQRHSLLLLKNYRDLNLSIINFHTKLVLAPSLMLRKCSGSRNKCAVPDLAKRSAVYTPCFSGKHSESCQHGYYRSYARPNTSIYRTMK